MRDEFAPEISYDQVLDLAHDFIETATSRHSAMEGIAGLLKASMPHYSWVGFYLLQDHGNTLKVGPYRGDPTPHIEIPLDKGICGAAVSARATVIVPDVNADSRYLSCSIKTKSEIVVPIIKGEKVFGEIDIDSETLNAFNEADRKLLEKISKKLADLFDRLA